MGRARPHAVHAQPVIFSGISPYHYRKMYFTTKKIALTLTVTAMSLQIAEAMPGESSDVAPFFGFMGAAIALVFSCVGAASMGVMRPELVMKSIVPVVMAGVLGIYGLINAVIISTNIRPEGYTLFQGYAHLSSGLACGLSGLAAGMAIGITGDAGVRANAQQPKLFTGILLIFIFSEALALYGLIVGIILASAGSAAVKPE